MKHKYVLYAIAILLVLNTGMCCWYAFQQSRMMRTMNEFIQSSYERLSKIETGLQNTASSEKAMLESERLDKLEEAFEQETKATRARLDTLADNSRMEDLSDRISNLEKIAVRHQVLLNQMETQPKATPSKIKAATE